MPTSWCREARLRLCSGSCNRYTKANLVKSGGTLRRWMRRSIQQRWKHRARSRETREVLPHSHRHHMDRLQISRWKKSVQQNMPSVPFHFKHRMTKASKHTCCWSMSCRCALCTSNSPADRKRRCGLVKATHFKLDQRRMACAASRTR